MAQQVRHEDCHCLLELRCARGWGPLAALGATAAAAAILRTKDGSCCGCGGGSSSLPLRRRARREPCLGCLSCRQQVGRRQRREEPQQLQRHSMCVQGSCGEAIHCRRQDRAPAPGRGRRSSGSSSGSSRTVSSSVRAAAAHLTSTGPARLLSPRFSIAPSYWPCTEWSKA